MALRIKGLAMSLPFEAHGLIAAYRFWWSMTVILSLSTHHYSPFCLPIIVFFLQPRWSDAGQMDGLVVARVQLHDNGISVQHLHHLWEKAETLRTALTARMA